MFDRLSLSALATFAALATTAFSLTSASAQFGGGPGRGHFGGGYFGGGHFNVGHGMGWGHHWGGGGRGQSAPFAFSSPKNHHDHYPRPGGGPSSYGTPSPGGAPASEGMSSPAYADTSSAASYCATPRGNCHLTDPQIVGGECRCVTPSDRDVDGIAR
jgi:hypothetical protein